jgi:hypothetical protein
MRSAPRSRSTAGHWCTARRRSFHPQQGVVLAVCYGTRYAIRVPADALQAALDAGCATEHEWTGGGRMRIDEELGAGWVLAARRKRRSGGWRRRTRNARGNELGRVRHALHLRGPSPARASRRSPSAWFRTGGRRRRVEGRVTDIAGLRVPTWDDVVRRDYEPWAAERVVIDTAGATVDQSLSALEHALRRERGEPYG